MRIIAFVIVTSSLASSAHAGLVFDEKVPLANVVRGAELAVTIKLDTPAETGVKIPVRAKKKCGAYEYGVYTGTVVEVIAPVAAVPPVRVGERLVVFPAATSRLLWLSASACEGGGSGSPIFERYEGAKPTDGAVLTAFLRLTPGLGWTEAIGGGWLAEKPSAEVLEPMQRRRSWATSEGGPREQDALCVVDGDCVLANVSCECNCTREPLARAAVTYMASKCPVQACACAAASRAPRCVAMKCVR